MTKQDVRTGPAGRLAELKRPDEKSAAGEKIAAAKDFDELYAAINGMGPVQGTCKLWTPEELVKRIDDFREGFKKLALLKVAPAELKYLLDSSEITHSNDINAKVGELMMEASKKPIAVVKMPLTAEEKIAAAKDFDELYAAINGMGNVKGTCNLWTPGELIENIDRFRADFGKMPAERQARIRSHRAEMDSGVYNADITGARGIRAKVVELMMKAKDRQAV